jgi:3-phenylpropionate/trans-cinnamate dioxygenase ferredoxin subunit
MELRDDVRCHPSGIGNHVRVGGVVAEFHKVCEYKSLFLNTKKRVTVAGEDVLIVRLGDDVYAVSEHCTHEETSLLDGTLHEGTISCPQHGARFELETGEALTPPAFENLKTYPVRVENGNIEVEI